MRVNVTGSANSADSAKRAAAVITILDGDHQTRLDGIVLRECRASWVVMDVPSAEIGRERLQVISTEQRQRTGSPEFVDYLQMVLSKRLLILSALLDW